MAPWERSVFAISSSERDLQEAVVAVLRVLDGVGVSDSTRQVLERALRALRSELS